MSDLNDRWPNDDPDARAIARSQRANRRAAELARRTASEADDDDDAANERFKL